MGVRRMKRNFDGSVTFETSDALLSLKPGAEWVIRGDTLTWKDDKQTEPTTSQINTEVARLQTEYTDNKYQRDRKDKYPEIGDQLDNLYKDILAGKVDSTGEFAKAIKAIKDANPKP